MKEIKKYDYFTFRGEYYGIGTEIELSDSFFQNGTSRHPSEFIGKKIYFLKRTKRKHEDEFLSFRIEGSYQFVIPTNSNYIKRIVKKVPYIPRSRSETALDNWNNKKGKPDTFNGWSWFFILIFVALFLRGSFIYIILIIVWFIDYLIDKYNF